MTEKEDPQVKRAEALGIDLGLLDENLRLTPLERMRQHDRTVQQILEVQERLGVAHLSDGDGNS